MAKPSSFFADVIAIGDGDQGAAERRYEAFLEFANTAPVTPVVTTDMPAAEPAGTSAANSENAAASPAA